MSPGADLFIVCKHCGSEVSPYITECPYCGHRLRRRAPKLPLESTPSRGRRGVLGRLGSGAEGESEREAPAPRRGRARRSPLRLPGALSGRPRATIALIAASCVVWVLLRAGYVRPERLVVVGPLHGDWWKLFSSSFSYLNGWYAFFVLIVVAIFGWLVERRHGPAVVLALFLGVGALGVLAATAAYPVAVVVGANAGALALLAAWAAPDLRDARADHYYEGDLLGAGALAALLLAIPFVRFEASWLAGVVGGAMGLLVGLGLPRGEHARM
ncbi:MAG TPA: rhomboid family intramembrane serine protease [Solirubrobacteraceae bacterium]|jgi:membrane associated rhomboid family serine protease|nr:rhomboid family intramembrane serine protease [Solirubrobacteraceae bacterium]